MMSNKVRPQKLNIVMTPNKILQSLILIWVLLFSRELSIKIKCAYIKLEIIELTTQEDFAFEICLSYP